VTTTTSRQPDFSSLKARPIAWPPWVHWPWPLPDPFPGPWDPTFRTETTTEDTLTEADRDMLQSVLRVLKEHPDGKTSSEQERRQLLAAACLGAGYLQGLGYSSPPQSLDSMAPTKQGVDLAGAYKAAVAGLESALNGPQGNDPQLMKFPWKAILKAVGRILVILGNLLIALAT
jgi:hypothetical protein